VTRRPTDPRIVCGTLLHLGRRAMDTVHGRFEAQIFLDLEARQPVLVLCRGDLTRRTPLLARVHSACMTSETFAGCDCDCAGQLDAALEAIGRRGRGIVFYLMQEGRGAGFVAKARDRMMVQASRNRVTTFDAYTRMGLGDDYRQYDAVAFARAALGIRAPLVLLTNNPDKVAALRGTGVPIAEVRPLAREASPFNRHYLAAKSRRGHVLRDGGGAAAELPEVVDYFEPHRLAARPAFMRVASYLLSIRPGKPGTSVHWFRLHAYVDLRSQRERVLFTYRADASALPLVRIQRESLFERFPLRARSPRRWRAAVEAMVRRGAGSALFLLHDDPAAAAGASPADDDDLAWLLAQHTGDRAQLLIDEPRATAATQAMGAALARHGVACSTVTRLHSTGGHA
jgi:GTP cyclohydrolase II